ncbi:hypothetical protein [Marilutibacter maris]|uniref:hypothetical protein n=1 Tax=Marilutibacter maris TaxID=1605891 RepID=UPI0011AE5A81|nr:hypothetical protein [Lysobacter maris]
MNKFMNRAFILSTDKLKIGIALCMLMLLNSACSDMSASELIGQWNSADNGATLNFSADGQFTAAGLPAQVACSDEDVSGSLSGNGTWDLDQEGRRVFLSFSKLSDPRCEVPYLGHVFFGDRRTLQVLPDVEKPWEGVSYQRVGNGRP